MNVSAPPPSGVARIEIPPKLVPMFAAPRGSIQYRNAYGGRGSGKSYNFALMAAVFGYAEPLRVLATREFQVSIRESFHAELRAAIEDHPWLADHYQIGVEYIRGKNGTEFFFRGLRQSIHAIRSMAGIDLTIVEEAEDVPEQSWIQLEPTIFRQPGSELWSIWNPRVDGSPVDKRMRKDPPANAITVEMNWNDNPFFPEGLNKLRLRDQKTLDPNTYAHIWDGEYLINSDAQVFSGKWRIEPFEVKPSWDGPYQGGDFGYAQDPTAATRCYIHGDILYISDEAGAKKLELDLTAAFIRERILDFDKYVTRWDSASPGSIAMVKRYGLPRSIAVDKWSGAIEDGIRFLRSFREIVIHPRCQHTIKEFRLYSYKVDRLSGDILPVVVDANNHFIDSLRYSITPLIKRSAFTFANV